MTMSVSDKINASSVNTKPCNVFFVWYVELCRRKNVNPLLNIKAPKLKNGTVLDFVGDRLKIDEWKPILNALYLDRSLHVVAIRSRLTGRPFHFDIDSEEKLRSLKKNVGCLWSDYVMQAITSSLCNCLLKSNVLSTVEIDGLPLFSNYFCRLMEAVRENRHLKVLSFKRCPIKDSGCEEICTSLRFLPHIEVLILSNCDLTHLSGESIGKLIKHQQINRYCETWNNSLRYTDPSTEKIAGLRRISLNNNPLIGNEGAEAILNELGDDLWIKAVDMQNCGITEELSAKLTETLNYNTTIEIADFRRNNLSFNTLNTIFEKLRDRLHFGGEYQWCLTTTTLDPNDAVSNYCPSTANIFQKSQSVPLQNFDPALKSTTTLRKAKTSADLHKQIKPILPKLSQPRNDYAELHKQVAMLSNRLKEEMRKRIEAEKANRLLQKKLEKAQKGNSSQTKSKPIPKKMGKLIEMLENLGITAETDDDETLTNINRILKEKELNLKVLLMDHIKNSSENRNGFQKKTFDDRTTINNKYNKKPTGTTNMRSENKFDNLNNVSETTSTQSEAPQSILEKFLYNTDSELDESDKEDGSDIIEDYYNINEGDGKSLSQRKNQQLNENQTGSTSSFHRLLNELDDVGINFSNSPSPSLSSDGGSSVNTVVERNTKAENIYRKVQLKVK